uniref:Cytosolic carboxypeptidase N-terminal domain-containing protein n=1 Tax=Sphenodon punctatus TaxID=8508 RepID=A0A8D0H3D0_SPHPU
MAQSSKRSDIGNDDIITGNISKYAALPVGYYGQPKKGHLIFDACFESGNLGRVDHITVFEYDLFIRPDTCNPRFRVWFNFTVENVKESQVTSTIDVVPVMTIIQLNSSTCSASQRQVGECGATQKTDRHIHWPITACF